MAAWVVPAMLLAYGAWKGAKAARAGDDQADKIEASTLLVAKVAEENKREVTQESYAETLQGKGIISGLITDERIKSQLLSKEVLAETGGSGVAADTGSTLDVQMAILNEGRKNEANLLAEMSIQKARNSWEAQEERKSIERHSQMEITRIRARASEVRQQGRDAKAEAYVGSVMDAITSYAQGGGFTKKKPKEGWTGTPTADKATPTADKATTARTSTTRKPTIAPQHLRSPVTIRSTKTHSSSNIYKRDPKRTNFNDAWLNIMKKRGKRFKWQN